MNEKNILFYGEEKTDEKQILCKSTLICNCNHILFTKLPWPGDSEGTFRSSSQAVTCLPHKGVRRRGLGVQPPPPIGLSTKMHNKQNITFLALLSLFFAMTWTPT